MKNIFVTGIKQESNSLNPLRSTYEDFRIISGQEMFEKVAGIKELAESGFKIISSIYANAVPAGTLELKSFLRLVDEMLYNLPYDGSVDGVFLPMHGALDVEYIGSAESYIAEKIRERVGNNIPISVPLDLHANNNYSLIKNCNIIYGYRTAPHIDVAETHIRAAELLIRALNEKVLPKTELIRIPMIMPGENMMTASGIGKTIIDRLPDIEKAPGVWCSSYFAGMPWIDCPQNGSAIVISGTGDLKEGIEKSIELGQYIWNNRYEFKYQGLSMEPQEALDFALSQPQGPVLISDSADNVTAGAAGDNALFLNLLIKNKVNNALVAAIVDPIAAEKCCEAGLGSTLDISVGGCIDSENSETCALEGTQVINITKSDTGALDGAVVRYSYPGGGDIDILLYTKRKPVPTEEVLNSFCLSVHNYHIVVVKQGYLTPQLDQLASASVMALTPGNCTQKLWEIPYQYLRRPMFPIDKDKDIPSFRMYEQTRPELIQSKFK